MKDNSDELLPIVNEQGDIVGKATRRECHAGTFILHPVVHLHIINNKGELYLQKRPEWKTIQPGKWDTAVGGHVDYGEDIQSAVIRETSEELGIKEIEPQFITTYHFTSKIESELVYIYFIFYNKEIKPSDETDGGQFWCIKEIIKSIGKGVFTPNFENEFTDFVLPYLSCFSLMNLPAISAKLKPCNSGFKIYDFIRKKYVLLTPEEAVRQRFTSWITSALSYPINLMNNEIQIELNGTKKRCDTVVFDQQCKPLMIIEYKAPTIDISQSVFDQIVRYNMSLEAKYLVVSNGISHYCCYIDYKNRRYQFLERIPQYDELKI